METRVESVSLHHVSFLRVTAGRASAMSHDGSEDCQALKTRLPDHEKKKFSRFIRCDLCKIWVRSWTWRVN